MAIDNNEVIDAIAYKGNKLILQVYDHLEFDGEIEKRPYVYASRQAECLC